MSSFEFFFAVFGFQEHRLEKEKHLEDYLRDHPPPPSSTTTKGPITTLSTNTSKPGSEGDKGSGEGTSNTDAKENTEPSTEPAKQSTPIEEPEADKTLKSVPLIQSKIYVILQIYMQFRQPPVVKVGQSRLKCFFSNVFLTFLCSFPMPYGFPVPEMFSEANGSVAGNNSRNATGPAAATSVDGLSESQHVTLLEG